MVRHSGTEKTWKGNNVKIHLSTEMVSICLIFCNESNDAYHFFENSGIPIDINHARGYINNNLHLSILVFSANHFLI